MADDSAIDPSLWTFNSANQRLELQTSDYTKAGPYTLKLRAKYNAAEYTAWQCSQQFSVTLVDPCLTCTVTLTPAQFFPLTQVYNLYEAALELPWTGQVLHS